MFVYKHTEAIAYFFKKKKTQTLRVNNSRIPTIKNTKFSVYYFYMNLNISGNFQICINVPLNQRDKLITQDNANLLDHLILWYITHWGISK